MLKENILANSYKAQRDDVDGFLEFFESYLDDLLHNLDEPLISSAKHVVLAGGKRIRPQLCFYCGSRKTANTKDLLKVSAIIELVHVATLVHDDLLDNAPIRRDSTTLHNVLGDHSAVLLGDALFSFALELATDFPTNRICKIVSKATRLTCSGEIRQTNAQRDFNLSLDKYYHFLQDKTGELFKASCQVGALLAGHSDEDINLVGEFGLQLGICYQIYDDLLDCFGEGQKSDKSLGSDFDSGKFTLPFILLLEELDAEQKSSISQMISAAGTERAEVLSQISNLYLEHGIISKCMNEFSRNFDSINLLINSLSDPFLRENLQGFLSYFKNKLSNLSNLSISNFLAVHQ